MHGILLKNMFAIYKAIMAEKKTSFYKQIETFWQSDSADAETQYRTFATFRKSISKTAINKSQKTLLELSEILLLRQLNRSKEADTIEQKHKAAFNRITYPIFKHRWKRLQLIEAFKRGSKNATFADVQELIKEAQKNTWEEELLRALFLKHIVEKISGKLNDALATAQQVKLLATEYRHSYYLRQSAWAIPHIYYYFGEKKLAYEECLRVKHLFDSNFSQQENRGFYVLLADCHAYFKHYSEALDIYHRLQMFIEQSSNQDLVALTTVLINTAHIYDQQRNTAQAEAQLAKAQQLAIQLKLPMYEITAHIGLAEIYLKTKRYKLMQETLALAAPAAEKANVTMYKIRLLELEAAYAKVTNQLKKALELTEKHHQQFKEWKQLDTEEKLKNLETKQQFELQQLKEVAMKKELELMEQNLQASHAHVAQKDKLIKQFAAYFTELEQTTIRRQEIFVKLREMIRTVEHTQQQEQIAYSTKFNKAHYEAMQKLLSKFPTVTHAEASTAIMLTKGLSNKDIASLTLTSVRNIEKHRLNLRKKMNLKRFDDLVKYILSIQ